MNGTSGKKKMELAAGKKVLPTARKEVCMKEDKGYILILSMMMLVVVTVIGLAAAQMSILEIKIAGNQLAKTQSFFHAESGWNEFIEKVRTGEMIDSSPSNPDWEYVASSSNWSVKATHALSGTGSVVMLSGNPFYIVESTGFENGGRQVNEVKLIQRPSLDPPAALYSKASVTIRGASTIIDGNNKCDGSQSKPGVMTTSSTITESGNPVVDGFPPKEVHSPLEISITDMVSYLKGYANFNYNSSSDVTVTGADWGTMTGGSSSTDPLKPVGSPNVVYFDMGGDKTVKLAGGSHGTGILLVNGNLDVSGGFSWYGIIIVTGSINFTGGGEKNITGGMLGGDAASVDVDIGGNISILYCANVKKYLEDKVRFMKVVYWRNKF